MAAEHKLYRLLPTGVLSIEDVGVRLLLCLVGTDRSRACCGDAGSQRTSYRSVKEAVEAARDGDQVILEPGIHNGMG